MILTHANREIVDSHTSGAEIKAFASFINKNIDYIQIRDYNDLPNYDDDIMIFITGKLHQNIKDYINNLDTNNQVFIVTQDPNWYVEFNIDRDVILIHPFERLKNLKPNTLRSILIGLLDWKISNISSHIFIPFGILPIASDFYLDKYKTTYLSHNTLLKIYNDTNTYMYYGSFKSERGLQMRYMSNNYDLSFWGNITKNNIKSNSKTTTYQMKTESPFEIPHVCKFYKNIVYISDYKMRAFGVNCLRLWESSKFNSKIFYIASINELFYKRLNDYINSKENDDNLILREQDLINKLNKSDNANRLYEDYLIDNYLDLMNKGVKNICAKINM